MLKGGDRNDWERFKVPRSVQQSIPSGMMTLITQNVEECLRSDTARLMFANSEFLVMLNQAPTDRAELARLLHISDTQLSAITNADVGCRLIKVGGSIVPFRNEFPKDTELYKLMSTTLGEK